MADTILEEYYNSPFSRKRSKNKAKIRKTILNVVVTLLLVGYALYLLVPFYVAFVTSITNYSEIRTTMNFIWWPNQIDVEDSYVALLTKDPNIPYIGMSSILSGFINTIWSSLLMVVVCLFMSGMAAFAYNKIHFKGRNVLFIIMISTMMIPLTALTMPSFIFFDSIGWTQSGFEYLPIIVPTLFGSATVIFFLYSYMTSIPNEVIEAAKIDGLNFFQIYVKIIIPECIPAFVGQFIFLFVSKYNNYAQPLIYLSGDEKLYTLQVALGEIRNMFSQSNQICASAIIAILPLIIIYIIFQKYFISGIAIGGGKE